MVRGEIEVLSKASIAMYVAAVHALHEFCEYLEILGEKPQDITLTFNEYSTTMETDTKTYWIIPAESEMYFQDALDELWQGKEPPEIIATSSDEQYYLVGG